MPWRGPGAAPLVPWQGSRGSAPGALAGVQGQRPWCLGGVPGAAPLVPLGGYRVRVTSFISWGRFILPKGVMGISLR